MDTAPELIPTLSRGSHDNPRQGACLMEYVSVLAGQPFSDRPSCTDPLLATIARVVNDRVSDKARPRLAGLAPDLAGAGRLDSLQRAVIQARCAAMATRLHPEHRGLARAAARTQARVDGLRERAAGHGRWQTLLDGALRRGRSWHYDPHPVLRHLVTDPDPDRDERLYDLLAACLREARPEQVPGATTAGDGQPARVPGRHDDAGDPGGA